MNIQLIPNVINIQESRTFMVSVSQIPSSIPELDIFVRPEESVEENPNVLIDNPAGFEDASFTVRESFTGNSITVTVNNTERILSVIGNGSSNGESEETVTEGVEYINAWWSGANQSSGTFFWNPEIIYRGLGSSLTFTITPPKSLVQFWGPRDYVRVQVRVNPSSIESGGDNVVNFDFTSDDINSTGESVDFFLDSNYVQGYQSVPVTINFFERLFSEQNYTLIASIEQNIPITNIGEGGTGTSEFVIPNWVAESAIGTDNPSLLMFRHDLRNALYEAIDTKVRQVIYANVDQMFDFNPGDDLSNFHITMASNSERVERIDSYIKQLEFRVEQALNQLGESQIQSLYASIYSQLKDLDTNLSEMIDSTIAKTVENYEKSEQLVLDLEAKAKQETLVQYTHQITNFPMNKMSISLFSQRTKTLWDISQYVSVISNQLVLDLPPLTEITGYDTIDNFTSWYVYIAPKQYSINTHSVTGNKIHFNTGHPITDTIWATIYDVNGQSYKIVNELSGNYILDKSFDTNQTNNPISISYNYFDPQLIKLDMAWLHNYVPERIPVGSLYQPISGTETIIAEEPQVIDNTQVIRGRNRLESKEIF